MDPEKDQTNISDVPVLPADEEVTGTRAVAFPDDHGDIREEKIQHLRPRGVEMKREMTKEDMELAAAGYEHLGEHKGKGKKGDDLDKVDIHEHSLPYDQLGAAFDTSIDTKEPSASYGLTSDEAKARLARDGHNVLTPPKKKSAFRKVRR